MTSTTLHQEDTTVSISGIVDCILFQSDEGSAVIKIKTPQGEKITVVGKAFIDAGDSVSVNGVWKMHPRFGKQVSATSITKKSPESKEALVAFFSSGAIKSIGKTYATKLIEHFGVSVIDVLNGENAETEILAVPGFGKKRASEIINAWTKEQKFKKYVDFITGAGLSINDTWRLFKAKIELEVIQSNPYSILGAVPRIGFPLVDKMALAAGVKPDSPLRIKSAAAHVMNEWSENGGHTIMPINDFMTKLSELLSVSMETLSEATLGLYKFGDNFVGGEDYLKEHYIAEQLNKRTEKLAFSGVTPTSVAVSGALITLDSTQLQSVNDALINRVHIITGGPGTGKTTIIAAYIKGLVSSGIKNIILAAPTGKAARRMEESTGFASSTIHRLLVDGGGSALGKAAAVIIDETSMADVNLIHLLLKAINEKSRILFVGDAFQLPSIGAGNVLRDMIHSKAIPVSTLIKVYRQGPGSGISVAAENIKNGEFPTLSSPDVTLIPTRERFESAEKIVEQYVFAHSAGLDVQVLTAMHKGECGTVSLNTAIQGKLHGAKPFVVYKNTKFHVGDKIIHIKNDYDLGVMNGEVGTVTAIGKKYSQETGLHVPEITANIDGRIVVYEGADLDMVRLAYALSVHKSQGSEYSRVILSVDKSQMFMLERHWLYTAVTRAKRTLILVGQSWAVKGGLEKVDSNERMTALATLLSAKQ